MFSPEVLLFDIKQIELKIKFLFFKRDLNKKIISNKIEKIINLKGDKNLQTIWGFEEDEY